MQDSVHVMIMTMTTRNLVALSFLASIVVAANAFAPSSGGGGRRYLSSIRTWSSSALGMGSGGGGSGGGGGLLDNLVAFLKNGKVGLVKSLAGDYDAVAVRNKIDGLVKENSVLMFSFTTCPYCIKGEIDAPSPFNIAIARLAIGAIIFVCSCHFYCCGHKQQNHCSMKRVPNIQSSN
jgi:hypothetical protein